MLKNEIRKINLEKLKNLNDIDKNNFSYLICQNLIKSDLLLSKQNILIYSSLRYEVSTKKILKYLINKNFNIYLPKIFNNDMFESLYNIDEELIIGAFSIPEPKHLIKGNIEIALVPLTAFSRDGNRVGKGKGYYDRYFLKNPNILKVALAYSFLEIDKIDDVNFQDIKMDYIITEKEIIKIENNKWQI